MYKITKYFNHTDYDLVVGNRITLCFLGKKKIEFSEMSKSSERKLLNYQDLYIPVLLWEHPVLK